MALASGPASFQRFYVEGSLSGDVTDEFVAALNERAFGKQPVQADDTQVGWVGPRHVFETEIAGEHIACGSFVQLAVRVDRLKVPPSVLKAYVRIEEETALQASGREFLSRGEQRRVREAARERADQEARAGEYRRIGSSPVLIDLQHGMVYLGSLSTTIADKLMQLFYETFGCNLQPVDSERAAVRVAERLGKLRDLESLAPFTLAKPPAGYGESEVDFVGAELNFLGKEFLTWLWYRIDAGDGPLQVSTGDEITVMIDKVMRLQCDFGLTGSDVISADSPTSLPEAKSALKIGKQPTRAGLILGSPLGEFRLTLEGGRLAVSGLIVPEEDDDLDARARLERRFEMIIDAASLVDVLFELYVEQRIGRDWSGVLRAMTAWAGGKTARSLSAASA